jgi:hypothetical protein
MHHLMIDIPKKTEAKFAIVTFGNETFAKVDMSRVKTPCKFYNIVFLAIETWINVDFEPEDKQFFAMLNSQFSNLLALMNSELGQDKVEKLIQESPVLE